MTNDPRIDVLAQAAGERIGNVDPGYYKMAAKEFLAFADALEGHYASDTAEPPPTYPIDVRAERERTASAIYRGISRALRMAETKTRDGDKISASTAASIAIELQLLLDELLA